MTHKVSDVITRANRLLQDETQVRWPESTMLDWINDAVRRTINAIPMASFVQTVIPLVPGVNQALPVDCITLIDVIQNVDGARVTPADSAVLDAELPTWRQAAAEQDVVHYLPPRTLGQSFFDVYPPQPDTPGQLLIQYSFYPAEVTAAEDDLPINDVYMNALVNFTCYRAMDQDTNNQANTERAARYFAGFNDELGITNG